jgi:hypothetical protein
LARILRSIGGMAKVLRRDVVPEMPDDVDDPAVEKTRGACHAAEPGELEPGRA